MTCATCGGEGWVQISGSAQLRCADCNPCLAISRPVSVPVDTGDRLALLEGQARDMAAVIDEMRCQLIDMQRRLQALEAENLQQQLCIHDLQGWTFDIEQRVGALESVEAMMQRGVEAFCLTLEEAR